MCINSFCVNYTDELIFQVIIFINKIIIQASTLSKIEHRFYVVVEVQDFKGLIKQNLYWKKVITNRVFKILNPPAPFPRPLRLLCVVEPPNTNLNIRLFKKMKN